MDGAYCIAFKPPRNPAPPIANDTILRPSTSELFLRGRRTLNDEHYFPSKRRGVERSLFSCPLSISCASPDDLGPVVPVVIGKQRRARCVKWNLPAGRQAG